MRSYKKAVEAKCKECIYDPLSGLGNWRQQVSACSSPTCPLYEFRPVSKPYRSKHGEERADTEE